MDEKKIIKSKSRLDESTEVYIKERVDDQIQWYDEKSINMQKKYKIFKSVTILSSAIIPIISLTNTNSINAHTSRIEVLEGKVGDGFTEITSTEIQALFA